MLSPRADCTAAVKGRWFVAEVQTKYEKALAWDCLALGVDYYLPLVLREKIISGVKRRNIIPLFPNYFFGNGEGAEKLCRESRHVLNLLTVGNQTQLRTELTNIEIALFVNPRLEICDVHCKGQKVRVVSGPFEGVEGEVEKLKDADGEHDALASPRGMVRVYIKCEILGQGTRLDVQRSDVVAI